MSRRALIGWVLAAAILATLVVHERQSRPTRAPAPVPAVAKTYAQLAAANYRTLNRAQSRRLVEFATAFRSCMDDRGIEITPPKAEVTKIVMRVETTPITAAIRASTIACGDSLGGPPTGSALQTPRGHPGLLVLYLPKQCLLDPTVTSG
jgi:hypothetical protein